MMEFRVTEHHVVEAISIVCGRIFPVRPKYLRLNYYVMAHLMNSMQREPLLIEEEERTYLVVLVPTGRLLIYADPECAEGRGVLVGVNGEEWGLLFGL